MVYAVSSAAAVLIADRAPHGVEHVRAMLVGNLLSVRPAEVVEVAALYAAVGLLHWLCRRPFFLISTDPETAYAQGWHVRTSPSSPPRRTCCPRWIPIRWPRSGRSAT